MRTLIRISLVFLPILLCLFHFAPDSKARISIPNYTVLTFDATSPFCSWFGISSKSAGDFNGDGYDDLVIGSPYPGMANVYYGGQVMNNVPDLVIYEGTFFDEFGWRVNCAGDVNNDGFDDIIVGERHRNNIGAAYIYFGGGAPDTDPDVVMSGEISFLSRFGYTVCSAGDVNGDNFDDVIVTDHYYGGETGRAYVFFGGVQMDSIPDVIFTGENPGDWLGSSSSSAGDVNNDSYDDFLLCAGRSGAVGKCYLFLGGPAVDNIPDLVFSGNYVSDAGDMNNDGYDDFMIADEAYNNLTGKITIYFGRNPVDSIADFVYHGEAESGQFGFGSSPCGDINRDGFSDILAGAYGLNDHKGRAYVYYGGRFLHDIPNIRLEGNTGYEERFGYSSSGTADVDGDSIPEVFVGAYYRNYDGGAYLFDEFLDTWVGGPEVCITNSPPVMFSASFHGGAWSLINYGSSASIVSVFHEKVVTVDPGGTSGRFVMLYSAYDSVYTCTKSVSVESPSPVEISSLSAAVHDRNNVILRWTTAQELNNSGFSIERKISAGEWTKAGFVSGKGNSSLPVDYSYLDKSLGSGTYAYRLVQTDYNGAFEIFEFTGSVTVGIPGKFSLSQNYPNPFNPVTKIEFEVPVTGEIRMEVFDMSGRLISVIYDKLAEAGYHSVKFDGSAVASGVYFYRLTAGSTVLSRKMILLK